MSTTAAETPGVKTSLLRSAAGLQNDGRLVELVRAGSTSAYEAIVRRYRTPLVRYCSGIVGPDHAEDVVQDTFARAHASLMGDDRPMSLKPWLYRIAHNLSLNTLQRKDWNHEQLDENFDGVRQPHEHLEQKDRLREIVARITGLPARQRTALILQAVEGRSSEEIARELGGAVGDVRMLVHRARSRLRDAIGALIPLPLLLRWMKHGSSPTAASNQAGGLLKIATGSLVKTGAVALTGLAAAGSVVIAERGGGERPASLKHPVASKHLVAGSAELERAAGNGPTGRTHRSRSASAGSRKAPGSDPITSDGKSSPATGESERHGNSPSPAPEQTGGGGGGSGSGDGLCVGPVAQLAPICLPSLGAGSAGEAPSSGDSTGGGSGGGSTGDGSGSEGLCVGPVAQLPPICLPSLGGGTGSGGGLLP